MEIDQSRLKSQLLPVKRQGTLNLLHKVSKSQIDILFKDVTNFSIPSSTRVTILALLSNLSGNGLFEWHSLISALELNSHDSDISKSTLVEIYFRLFSIALSETNLTSMKVSSGLNGRYEPFRCLRTILTWDNSWRQGLDILRITSPSTDNLVPVLFRILLYCHPTYFVHLEHISLDSLWAIDSYKPIVKVLVFEFTASHSMFSLSYSMQSLILDILCFNCDNFQEETHKLEYLIRALCITIDICTCKPNDLFIRKVLISFTRDNEWVKIDENYNSAFYILWCLILSLVETSELMIAIIDLLRHIGNGSCIQKILGPFWSLPMIPMLNCLYIESDSERLNFFQSFFSHEVNDSLPDLEFLIEKVGITGVGSYVISRMKQNVFLKTFNLMICSCSVISAIDSKDLPDQIDELLEMTSRELSYALLSLLLILLNKSNDASNISYILTSCFPRLIEISSNDIFLTTKVVTVLSNMIESRLPSLSSTSLYSLYKCSQVNSKLSKRLFVELSKLLSGKLPDDITEREVTAMWICRDCAKNGDLSTNNLLSIAGSILIKKYAHSVLHSIAVDVITILIEADEVDPIVVWNAFMGSFCRDINPDDSHDSLMKFVFSFYAACAKRKNTTESSVIFKHDILVSFVIPFTGLSWDEDTNSVFYRKSIDPLIRSYAIATLGAFEIHILVSELKKMDNVAIHLLNDAELDKDLLSNFLCSLSSDEIRKMRKSVFKGTGTEIGGSRNNLIKQNSDTYKDFIAGAKDICARLIEYCENTLRVPPSLRSSFAEASLLWSHVIFAKAKHPQKMFENIFKNALTDLNLIENFWFRSRDHLKLWKSFFETTLLNINRLQADDSPQLNVSSFFNDIMKELSLKLSQLDTSPSVKAQSVLAMTAIFSISNTFGNVEKSFIYELVIDIFRKFRRCDYKRTVADDVQMCNEVQIALALSYTEILSCLLGTYDKELDDIVSYYISISNEIGSVDAEYLDSDLVLAISSTLGFLQRSKTSVSATNKRNLDDIHEKVIDAFEFEFGLFIQGNVNFILDQPDRIDIDFRPEFYQGYLKGVADMQDSHDLILEMKPLISKCLSKLATYTMAVTPAFSDQKISLVVGLFEFSTKISELYDIIYTILSNSLSKPHLFQLIPYMLVSFSNCLLTQDAGKFTESWNILIASIKDSVVDRNISNSIKFNYVLCASKFISNLDSSHLDIIFNSPNAAMFMDLMNNLWKFHNVDTKSCGKFGTSATDYKIARTSLLALVQFYLEFATSQSDGSNDVTSSDETTEKRGWISENEPQDFSRLSSSSILRITFDILKSKESADLSRKVCIKAFSKIKGHLPAVNWFNVIYNEISGSKSKEAVDFALNHCSDSKSLSLALFSFPEVVCPLISCLDIAVNLVHALFNAVQQEQIPITKFKTWISLLLKAQESDDDILSTIVKRFPSIDSKYTESVHNLILDVFTSLFSVAIDNLDLFNLYAELIHLSSSNQSYFYQFIPESLDIIKCPIIKPSDIVAAFHVISIYKSFEISSIAMMLYSAIVNGQTSPDILQLWVVAASSRLSQEPEIMVRQKFMLHLIDIFIILFNQGKEFEHAQNIETFFISTMISLRFVTTDIDNVADINYDSRNNSSGFVAQLCALLFDVKIDFNFKTNLLTKFYQIFKISAGASHLRKALSMIFQCIPSMKSKKEALILYDKVFSENEDSWLELFE